MKVKVLVCQRSLAELGESEIAFFQSNHFHCHCFYGWEFNNADLPSKDLVPDCDKYPLLSDYIIEETRCTCNKLGYFEIWSYCIKVRYMFNFNSVKCLYVWMFVSKKVLTILTI